MRNTIIVGIVVVTVAVAIATIASTSKPKDIPSGVKEKRWIRLNDSVGLVLLNVKRVKDGNIPVNVKCRLMVKIDDQWCRAELEHMSKLELLRK